MPRGGQNAVVFDQAYVVADNGCWVWQRGKFRSFGHGIYRGRSAHRYAYEQAFGPIPKGMLVCHSCDNPPCVNPAHLWLGTNLDNMRDMVAKGRHSNQRKTHCKNGHEYSLENTYRHDGGRFCRVCNRAAVAALKKREAALAQGDAA